MPQPPAPEWAAPPPPPSPPSVFRCPERMVVQRPLRPSTVYTFLTTDPATRCTLLRPTMAPDDTPRYEFPLHKYAPTATFLGCFGVHDYWATSDDTIITITFPTEPDEPPPPRKQ